MGVGHSSSLQDALYALNRQPICHINYNTMQFLVRNKAGEVGLVSVTVTGSNASKKDILLISETLGSAGIEVPLSKEEHLPRGDTVRTPPNVDL